MRRLGLSVSVLVLALNGCGSSSGGGAGGSGGTGAAGGKGGAAGAGGTGGSPGTGGAAGTGGHGGSAASGGTAGGSAGANGRAGAGGGSAGTTLCGNGTLDPGETCDPPDGVTCDATCSLVKHDGGAGSGGAAGRGGAGGGVGGSGAGTGPICEQPSTTGVWGAITSTNNPRTAEAIAPGEVWGSGPKGVVRWSGTDWVPQFTGFFPNFGLVRGTSGTNVWATNGATSIEQWNGVSWTDVSPPGLPTNAQSVEMRVLSASEAWMLYTVPPESGSLVLHRDSTGWTQVPLPPEAQVVPNAQYADLSLLWATSSNDVWIAGTVFELGVGTTAAFLHWNGATLATVPSSPFSPGGQYNASAIWAAAANDVWVGGTLPSPSLGGTLQHFDGVHWTVASLSTLDPVTIWGWCSTSVWVVTGGSVVHFDGSVWTSTGTGNGSELSGTGPDDVWLSGPLSITNVRHWNPNVCGDHAIGPGETCDPPTGPSSNGGQLCDSTCHVPTCGNLVVDPGETCDPPNDVTCDRTCQTIPIGCGNGIVQPGELCDFDNPQLCLNCQQTACGSCFGAVGGGGVTGAATVCSGLDVTDSLACSQLVACGTQNMAFCAGRLLPIFGALGCYCNDSNCSGGANGPCAPEFEALAHSTDPAVVRALIGNPSTPVGKVAAALVGFLNSSCGSTCSVMGGGGGQAGGGAGGTGGAGGQAGSGAGGMGGASGCPALTEFPLPAWNTPAGGLTVGPDNALWLTMNQSVLRITPAGGVSVFPTSSVGNNPHMILGPDGNLWFDAAQALGRVTPAGAIAMFPTSDVPNGLVVGPDGNIWFTPTATGAGRLDRMTVSGVVSQRTVVGLTHADLAYAQGAFWAVQPQGVGRIVAADALDDSPGAPPAPEPLFVTSRPARTVSAGPDGSVWYTTTEISPGGPAKVGRLGTAGEWDEFPISGMAARPAVGADGSAWTMFWASSSQFVAAHITPSGTMTTCSVPPSPGGEIIIGPDQHIWFTEPSLGRIATFTP